MDRPPFRFAVQATNAASARDWREFVCKVEQLGYSTLFLADHYLGPGPAQQAARTPRQDLAPIAAIASAAAYTRRSASVAACSASTTTFPPCWRRKRRRWTCCPTAGSSRHRSGLERRRVRGDGLEFDTPGRRIAKLKEVVALVKAHCARRTGPHGRVRQRQRLRGTPPPVQRPHPPIMIGGGGKRVLTYAGREADIVSINTVPFAARNDDGLTHGRTPSAESNTCGRLPVRASATRHRELAVLPLDHRRRRCRLTGAAPRPASTPTCSAITPTSWSARRKPLPRAAVHAEKRSASTTSPSSRRRPKDLRRSWRD